MAYGKVGIQKTIDPPPGTITRAVQERKTLSRNLGIEVEHCLLVDTKWFCEFLKFTLVDKQSVP